MFLDIELSNKYWMYHALRLAKRAYDEGEVPVGAVLVYNNKIIGEGWNRSISQHDPTAHAEIIAMRQGGLVLKNYRLVQCVIYSTLEPCIMCSAAMIHGRIFKLVYGTKNEKNGAAGSLIDIFKYPNINHEVKVIGGVLESVCSDILNIFFKSRRLNNKKIKKELKKRI